MRLQKRRAQLIGFGFLWMAFWAVLGSLLGFRLQEEIISGQSVWLESVQRDLFRSAHAHMNILALVCVCVGYTLPFFARVLREKLLHWVSLGLPVSTATFGVGLFLEAMNPPRTGHFSPASLVTALGGTLLIICFVLLGTAALRGKFNS